MHTSARREQLLDLAEAVLEEHGLDEFGIGVLARAAGIRPPSLYKHFAGREDIDHALISRGFLALGEAFAAAGTSIGDGASADAVATFARVYRGFAHARPQRYRLMTSRPLQRHLLQPGAELAGMAPLLELFGESQERHDDARAAWAWAHGLVDLELSGRFPPGADVDAAWQVLVEALASRARGD